MTYSPQTITRPRRQSLPAQVAEILTQAVLTGRFTPGSTLPPERELAEQLGINRTSLRQALARLEQAGLVESRQGVGTVVRDPAVSSDGALALRALSLAGPDLVAEVLEVRESLGALAGRLAAERATVGALAELTARFEAAVAVAGESGRSTDGVAGAAGVDGAGSSDAGVVASSGPGALQAAELDFFSQLVAATGNRPLQVMMSWLEQLYGEAAPLFQQAFADGAEVVGALEQVLEAVTSHDGGRAEQAVRDYARSSGERFLAVARDAGAGSPEVASLHAAAG